MSGLAMDQFNADLAEFIDDPDGLGDTIDYSADGGVTPWVPIRGVWQVLRPAGAAQADGRGLISYTGQAQFTVKNADLPTDMNPKARWRRLDEIWAVQHDEPQECGNHILHMSRPDEDVRARR